MTNEHAKLLPLNLQFFAENEPEPADEPTPAEAEKTPSAEQSKTFTQEEVDRIIADRIARERKKLDKYADYDELKSKAAEYEKELEEKRLAELSEKERAEELAKKFEEERNALSQQLEELNSRVQREKITNAFIKSAPSVNIPPERIDAALKLADLSAVKVDKNGAVAGLDDVLKTLVDQYSFLVDVKTPKPVGSPTNGGESGSSDEVKTLEMQLEEAKSKKDFRKVIDLSNKLKQFLNK